MEPIGYSFLISYFSLTVLAPYKKSYLTTHAVRTKELSPDGEEEFFPRSFVLTALGNRIYCLL